MNANYSVSLTVDNNASPTNRLFATSSKMTTSFYAHSDSATGMSLQWIAIGY